MVRAEAIRPACFAAPTMAAVPVTVIVNDNAARRASRSSISSKQSCPRFSRFIAARMQLASPSSRAGSWGFCIKARKPAFQTSGVRLPCRKANLRKAHWLPNLRVNGSGLGISPIWRRSYFSEEGEYRSHFLPESESEQHVINPRENNIEDFGMMVFEAICIKPHILVPEVLLNRASVLASIRQ